jgi:hypothetical protein
MISTTAGRCGALASDDGGGGGGGGGGGSGWDDMRRAEPIATVHDDDRDVFGKRSSS